MPQTLFGKTSTGPGESVYLKEAVGQFSMAVRVASSTKCAVRLQGSLDGIRWTDLGAAASTYTSTQLGIVRNTTSAVLYDHVRLNVTSKGAGAAPQISGWVNGKGA